MATKTKNIRNMSGLLGLAVCGFFVTLTAPSARAQQEAITNDEGITFQVLPEETDTGVISPPTPCEGNNYFTNAFNNNIFMGGPLVGISWTPSNTVTICRIEVFTGETHGPIALAIWTHDAVNNRPGSPLSYTNSTSIALPNSWQGANLITPVTVNSSQKYWVVFKPTGGEQAPVQNANGQTYWGSYVGSVQGPASWFGPFSSQDHGWKFRMICCTHVPTVSELGLGALALLLLSGVAIKFARRPARH